MRRTPGILISVVLAAGCSDGTPFSSGSISTTPTTATTTASTTGSTTTHDVAADKQSASTIVLKTPDAGSGFTGTAHDTKTDDDLGSCVNQDPLLSGTVLACLTDLFKASAATDGAKVPSLTSSPLTVAAGGDDVFAYKLQATGTKPGKDPIHVTMYDLLVRKGRVLNRLRVTGLNVVPPLSLATRLATTMATRAATVQ